MATTEPAPISSLAATLAPATLVSSSSKSPVNKLVSTSMSVVKTMIFALKTPTAKTHLGRINASATTAIKKFQGLVKGSTTALAKNFLLVQLQAALAWLLTTV